jgi:uncharacterized protein
MRYLLLIALFFLVLWLLRKLPISRPGAPPSPASKPSERMVKCAYCGVNQPVSESILTNGRYYCCVAHQHEDNPLDD